MLNGVLFSTGFVCLSIGRFFLLYNLLGNTFPLITKLTINVKIPRIAGNQRYTNLMPRMGHPQFPATDFCSSTD